MCNYPAHQKNPLISSKKKPGRPSKLSARDKRLLIHTPLHKQTRRKLCYNHENGHLEDWACASFSDESNFEVGLNVSSIFVRHPCQYLLPTFKSGRVTVGVWAAIGWDFKSELVFLPPGVRMNSSHYTSILSEFGYPHYERSSEKHGIAYWIDAGAPYHTSKAVKEWTKNVWMNCEEWPAQFPDLNPIENLWMTMKRRVSKIRHKIHSTEQMKDELQKIWDSITQEEIQSLMRSMPRRMKAVIAAKGAHQRRLGMNAPFFDCCVSSTQPPAILQAQICQSNPRETKLLNTKGEHQKVQDTMSECYPQQNSPSTSCGADELVYTTLEELLQRNPQTRMSDLPTGTRVLVNTQYWVTVGKEQV
ncbi:transposable element Tcb2 transposase [Histoplasma capsulatum G186AR]|uniref:Transposable element Tcb2 transposase n=1 Tax=Ajellomyces capsulatus (strain G186AR / H82 / ATCC MYA-2454 / RMSCC 2432) TaxID=447093 RepID=C0NPT2_AJECG|nr:transposable element Tcb2 transposase [Histoplasma capsulatum G186AR]EEH06942.1 transposable element Tcb2 transposase [Histoplasma capsulatum G186AR]